jgi:hypothetical protein
MPGPRVRIRCVIGEKTVEAQALPETKAAQRTPRYALTELCRKGNPPWSRMLQGNVYDTLHLAVQAGRCDRPMAIRSWIARQF